MDSINNILHIIADEAGIPRDELVDDCEFSDLGIDDILAKCIVSRVRELLRIDLPSTIFLDSPTVADLKSSLGKHMPLTETGKNGRPQPPAHEKSDPLSFVLQGTPQTCRRRLFLLPDGSGSAMAYARLPKIGPDICLVALNSPYLRAGASVPFDIGHIADLWANEIQSHQRHGPYLLGGWSAGGYYAFEVAKQLLRRGEIVDRLVLIDSPCRLVYEALPMDVVQYLSTNNLMGNWGAKAPPEWLIDHFNISIRAIQNYIPTKMIGTHMPDVFIIWATEGMLKGRDHSLDGLDMNVKVTRMLIERPESSGALGWDGLFPGARVQVAKMPGNHFTIVYPPYCDSLSALLRDVTLDVKGDFRGSWQVV